MTYDEALKTIINSYRVGSKSGFEVCRRVLDKLGNPHEKLDIIHVAGTNGKGSTCAFLQNILMEEGYKTAMFTSPHLFRFNERFNINGIEITNSDFAAQVYKVKTAFFEAFGHDVFHDLKISLSFFEFLTIMAFNYFYEKNVDYVILEVGLGGRTDATNIIEKPLISIITAIGYDHMHYLGDSIEKIAFEKGGIIKKNCPTVLYYQSKEVYNVINGLCMEKNSMLYYNEIDNTNVNIVKNDINGIEFSVTCDLFSYDKIVSKMFGNYQIYNLVNLLAVIFALNDNNLIISEKSVISGILKAKWPGRMEIIRCNPLIVLEGAHNIEGASSAKQSIYDYFVSKKIKVTLVAAIFKDKEYSKIINTLSAYADKIILTQPVYSQRAAAPAELFEKLAPELKEKVVLITDDYKYAIDKAIELTDADDVVFVSGSLYLVGDVRKYLEEII